ncbi:MAG: deoxyribose-phosphate aldolase [Bacteroidia bacterium]|nr:deoxyribose-phosphate aldolase [Bacteroidia bacterium]
MKARQIAEMIDHALLHPTLTEAQLISGIELAKKYQVASVCIKPYAVPLAAKLLQDSPVKVCTVIGFPHGNHSSEVKAYETTVAIKEGAEEIDMVVNVGKVLDEHWGYVKADIAAVQHVCQAEGVILKVIFENAFLPIAHHKIRLCEICSDLKVDYVKTSTGFGYVKDIEGNISSIGALDEDLILMRKHSAAEVKIKASGGIRNLEDALRVRELGANRIGASGTEKIVEEAISKFGA